MHCSYILPLIESSGGMPKSHEASSDKRPKSQIFFIEWLNFFKFNTVLIGDLLFFM